MGQSWGTELARLPPCPTGTTPRKDFTSLQHLTLLTHREYRIGCGMITLNLGVVRVLHQNGWVQGFENYLRGRSKPEPLASPHGPTPPSSGPNLALSGRLHVRVTLVTDEVINTVARGRRDPWKEA